MKIVIGPGGIVSRAGDASYRVLLNPQGQIQAQQPIGRRIPSPDEEARDNEVARQAQADADERFRKAKAIADAMDAMEERRLDRLKVQAIKAAQRAAAGNGKRLTDLEDVKMSQAQIEALARIAVATADEVTRNPRFKYYANPKDKMPTTSPLWNKLIKNAANPHIPKQAGYLDSLIVHQDNKDSNTGIGWAIGEGKRLSGIEAGALQTSTNRGGRNLIEAITDKEIMPSTIIQRAINAKKAAPEISDDALILIMTDEIKKHTKPQKP